MNSAIAAAAAYISASQSAGTAADAMASIKQNQLNNLKSMISRMNLNLPDATNAIQRINTESPFTAEQNKELVSVIHGKMQGSVPLSKDAAQRYQYIYNYATDHVWAVSEDKCKTQEEVCASWSDLCLDIGLPFPDPITRKTIVA